MRRIGLSLVSGICLLAATTANADELRLSDDQLDQVTAGALDLATLNIQDLLSGDYGVENSPLLRDAAVIVAVTIANEFEAQNPGESALDNPVITPVVLGLYEWGLDRSTTFPLPDTTPAP